MGRLTQKYGKELHCRSALKKTLCVKISDAKTHKDVDGKAAVVPKEEETGIHNSMCQTWLSLAMFTYGVYMTGLTTLCFAEKRLRYLVKK